MLLNSTKTQSHSMLHFEIPSGLHSLSKIIALKMSMKDSSLLWCVGLLGLLV